ncbi:DNA-binding protein [Psychrobacter pacificensis]|uniref:DNA-binding protein n=1 Tax=Psychrobacter pacificensis TaxID=112002 RepID=UPI001BAE61B1
MVSLSAYKHWVRIWQTAVDIANDRLVKDREALESIKAKAQAETDEAQEAVKTLEGEQADLLVQLDEVTTTAETKLKRLNRRSLNVIRLSRP